jgi:hypothetical protein
VALARLAVPISNHVMAFFIEGSCRVEEALMMRRGY